MRNGWRPSRGAQFLPPSVVRNSPPLSEAEIAMLVFVGSTVIATERPPHLAWLDGEVVLVALRVGWNSLTELRDMAKAGINGLVAGAAAIACGASRKTCTPS